MDAKPAHPWLAEVPVDEHEAARMIHDGVPDLRGLPVRYLGAGWDNTAFRVGEEWLARFPRKEASDALLATECAVLPGLATELPLEIPAARYAVGSSEGYPFRFAVSRWQPGDAASDVELPEASLAEQRRAHIEPLAGFLRALHRVPATRPFLADLPRESDAKGRREAVAERARKALGEAHEAGLIEPAPAYETILSSATSHDLEASDIVVSHGDLDARHVIVRDGAVTSVIDWGDVQCCERAVDLALAPSYFEPQDWSAFRSAYGAGGDAARDADWDGALLYALLKSALILRYAVLDGKEGFERSARATLRRLRTIDPNGPVASPAR